MPDLTNKKILPLLLITLLLNIFSTEKIHAESLATVSATENFAHAEAIYKKGNYKDAFILYKKLLLTQKKFSANAVKNAISALQRLNRHHDTDMFINKIIDTYKNNYLAYQTAAELYSNKLMHSGYMQNDKFHRGYTSNYTTRIDTRRHDQLQALKYMSKAEKLLHSPDIDNKIKAKFYYNFAHLYISNINNHNATELLLKSNLTNIPAYTADLSQYNIQSQGSPVNEVGKPIFFALPESAESAKNDGELFRWYLNQSSSYVGNKKDELKALAEFSQELYGIETITSYYPLLDSPEKIPSDSPVSKLHLLKDNQTVARLANGIQQFNLPSDYAYLPIYIKLTEDYQQTNYARKAAELFSQRNQFVRAAEYWQIYLNSPAINAHEKQNAQEQLTQITGNFIRFDSLENQSANQLPELTLLHRNTEKVNIKINKIAIKNLLTDTISYIKSYPQFFNNEHTELSDLGWRIISMNQQKYIQENIYTESIQLHNNKTNIPHATIKETITLQRKLPAGVYLVEASLADNYTCYTILWISELAITNKYLSQTRELFLTSNAETGEKIPHTEIDIFGFSPDRNNPQLALGEKFIERSAKTDSNGALIMKNLPLDYAYIVRARSKNTNTAYLGITNFFKPYYYQVIKSDSIFYITDKPLYKSGEEIKATGFLRNYDPQGGSNTVPADNRKLTINIYNPKSEKVGTKTVRTDDNGKFDFTYQSKNADTLGYWRFSTDLPDLSETGNSFRIEEYKKPEYTLTINPPEIAPSITDNFKVSFQAKYLFGSPLQNAQLDYTVTRSPLTITPFKNAKWDWLYGKGYLSRSLDEFSSFCLPCPPPYYQQPEIITEGRIYTDREGNAEINIKPILDKNKQRINAYEYNIVVRTRDSNNNITEKSETINIYKDEFSLLTKLDKNFYQQYDTIKAIFSREELTATTNNNNNTLKQATLRLYNIMSETKEVLITKQAINSINKSTLNYSIKTTSYGLHRLECETRDNFNNTVKTSVTFFIIPEKEEEVYIAEPLSVIPEFSTYKPDEKARILILSKEKESTVFLFSPDLTDYNTLDITNNISVFDYTVSTRDIPNTFFTGITTTAARLQQAAAEIFIPPTEKILNLSITPVQTKYQPGAKAKLRLKALTPTGKPFSGSGVITVYDKALDQLADNHYPSIKDFFWGFLKSNITSYISNLNKYAYNIYKDKTTPMEKLGRFDTFSSRQYSNYPRRMNKSRAGNMLDIAFADSAAPEMMLAAAPMSAKGEASPAGSKPVVRKDFSTSAFFTSKIIFDSNGEAEIDFALPDTLTEWQVKFWAITPDTAVNQAEINFVTAKDLVIIPNIPRFLVKGDHTDIYFSIYNNSNSKLTLTPTFTTADNINVTNQHDKHLTLPAKTEQRITVSIAAMRTGESKLRLSVGDASIGDGVELTLPVIKDSQMIFKSETDIISDTDNHKIEFTIPQSIDLTTAAMQLRVFPDLHSLLQESYSSIKRNSDKTNDNIINRILPELYLYLTSTASEQKRMSSIKVIQNKFDRATAKLLELQLHDGGWSWIGRGRTSSVYITAEILYSLEKARKLGINIPAAIITSARLYLLDYQMNELAKLNNIEESLFKSQADNLDALVYTTLAAGGNNNAAMRRIIFRDRLHLSIYSLSLFAEGLIETKDTKLLSQVLTNLQQYLVIDDENKTAYLEYDNYNYWWRWYGSELEATANYLGVLLQTKEMQNIHSRIIHYLLNNLRLNKSTQSLRRAATLTAAVADYILSIPATKSTGTLAVVFNNSEKKSIDLNNSNNPIIVNIANNDIINSNNTLLLSSDSSNPLYYTTTLSYESSEDIIPAAGKEIKTERSYYLLTPEVTTEQLPDPLGGEKENKNITYKQTLLKPDSVIHTGDLIETVITLKSKNDYEYLKLSENKTAAFEPLESKSGYRYTGLSYYVEYRNQLINYYIPYLPRGEHTLKYRSYSIFSGKFSAMPAYTRGVYAVELNSNSNEFKFSIAGNK